MPSRTGLSSRRQPALTPASPSKRSMTVSPSKSPTKRLNAAKKTLYTQEEPYLLGPTPGDVAEKVLRARMFYSGTSTPRPELIGFSAERARLATLFMEPLKGGQSNSVLVIGPRSAGKTLLIDTALADVYAKLSAESMKHGSREFTDMFVEVRLNGLTTITERDVINAISSQLGLEHVPGDVEDRWGDEEGDGDNDFALTSSSQLAAGSSAERLTFVLDALRGGSSESTKAVLFVLEEFDLFTAAGSRCQSLLYNLLDAAASGTTPTCVVGVTCRHDVQSLLDKRTMSRSSLSVIYMLGPTSFAHYCEMFEYYLTVTDGEVATAYGFDKENEEIPSSMVKESARVWNDAARKFVAMSTVRDRLKQYMGSTRKDVRAMQRLSFILIISMRSKLLSSAACGSSDRLLQIGPTGMDEALKLLGGNRGGTILLDLSVLQLTLIIAARKLSDIYENTTAGGSGPVAFNFRSLHEKLSRFCERQSKVHMFSREVVWKAFEHLVKLELIWPVGGAGKKVSPYLREYAMMALAVEESEIRLAVKTFQGCSTEIKQWALNKRDNF